MDREWKQWPLLLTVTLGVGLSGVPVNAMGVFMIPMTRDMGWTRAEFALTMSISAIVVALVSPIAGRLADAFGARRVILTSTPAACLAIALLGTVRSYEVYVAVMLLAAVAFSLCYPLVWAIAVATRFVAHRGLALSISLSGSNIVGACVPLLSAVLVAGLGWRGGWFAVAAFMFLISMPLALMFFYDSSDLNRRSAAGSDARQDRTLDGATLAVAMAKREFWIFAVFMVLVGACMLGVMLHFMPMLLDRGVPTYIAAGALGAMSLGAVAGKVAVGPLIDRFFAPRIATLVLLLPAIACARMLAGGAAGSVLPYLDALLIGIGMGAILPVLSFVTARYFGLRNYGTINGLLFGCYCIGQAIGPYAAGVLYDRDGNYILALQLLLAGLVTASAILLLCRAYPKHEPVGEPARSVSPT